MQTHARPPRRDYGMKRGLCGKGPEWVCHLQSGLANWSLRKARGFVMKVETTRVYRLGRRAPYVAEHAVVAFLCDWYRGVVVRGQHPRFSKPNCWRLTGTDSHSRAGYQSTSCSMECCWSSSEKCFPILFLA
jgi:hypothetical protein